MRAPRLLLRRGRAQRGALLTLLVLTATVAAILAGSVGYTRAAGVATVRAALTEAAPHEAGVQVRTRLAGDPEAQDAAVRAAVSELLGPGTDVSRSLWSEAVGAAAGGQELRVVLAELPAGDGVVLADGELPGPREVLVPEQAAAETGLTTGGEIVVDGVTLTVAGTWQPGDERAWFTGPSVEDAVGPLLTDAGTVRDAVSAPFARWTVQPRAELLTVADLPGLADGLARLDFTLGDDDAVAVRGLTVAGELAATIDDLRAATATAAAVGLVPVALLGVVSVVALVQVVRLLGQTRARETEILVARGAAVRQVTAWSAAELAAVALVGGAVGTAVAAVVVGRLDGGEAQRGVIVATGVVVALVTALTGTAVAGLQARAIARRRVADRSGRLRGAAAVGTVVLCGAAAVLSAWQLLRHGTPLLDDGGADVLAVVSLGAVLGFLAVLALALLGPLARGAARLRERERGLAGVLATRQVSRRVRAYAVPLVLVVLAVGATTVASSFAGATATQREHVAALATGTDVRVAVPAGATSRQAVPQALSAAPYRELAGVTAAGTVLRSGGTFGELPVAVTALDAARLDELAHLPDGPAVPDAAAGLAPAAWGVPLPAGAQTLDLTLRAHLGTSATAREVEAELLADARQYYVEGLGMSEEEADAALAEDAARDEEEHGLELAAWVADADGGLSMLEGGRLPADPDGGGDGLLGPEPSEHTLRLELPGSGEHRLVALDLALAGPDLGSDVSVEVTALTADGAAVGLGDEQWRPAAALDEVDLEPQGTIGVAGGLGWDLPPDAEVRLVPGGAAPAVPAVLTSHLAASADLRDGDTATVALGGAAVDVTVSDVVDAVPGGLEEDAVLLDLGALGAHVLGRHASPLLPGEVWLAVEDGADHTGVADAAAALAGPEAAVEIAGEGLSDSAGSVRQTFWTVAAGAALLALTGVAAVVLSLARERRGEVVVLRALGLPAAGQARTRAAELLGVGALGVLLGVLAGWAASVVLVPTLARAAATQPSPLPLGGRLDVLPALGVLAVLVGGLAVVAAVLGARVRSQALDAEYREEVR
ncbi:FtsX-like permease family protein [Georgenia satyanarayanai]|uniref:FtsX-like permease family protein n=1 Tax=Georgenia satyanarayanai TaxID=860221 RepID=A0A2Y9APS8_9MICO|nr:FtsX-like permease family protein [Georgenia satyanarayanai]PYF96818.1 FtsX-like permease family protein [Georgenia satyanarayanai]SSA46414.1 FtsX-like permease family protein [Georgenia satyanarayanai]